MKARASATAPSTIPLTATPSAATTASSGTPARNAAEVKPTENTDSKRIRRITGYLVGTLDRFNNAKRAEVRDRVKHSIVTEVKLEAKD